MRSSAASIRSSSRPSTSGGGELRLEVSRLQLATASPSSSPVGWSHVPGWSSLDSVERVCAWNLRFPASLHTLTQAEHDVVLGRYFALVTPWQLRVLPGPFMRDIQRARAGESGLLFHSPALHCALLADAASFAEPTSILRSPSTCDDLARAAFSLAQTECTTGEQAVAFVVALTILVQHHLAAPQGEKMAYMILGFAVRAALLANMNSGGNSLETEAEWGRTWCYWSLFIQVRDW